MKTGSDFRASKSKGGGISNVDNNYYNDQPSVSARSYGANSYYDPTSRSFHTNEDEGTTANEEGTQVTAEWYRMAGGNNDHLEDFDSQMPDYSSLKGEAPTATPSRARAWSKEGASLNFEQDVLNEERSVNSHAMEDIMMDQTIAPTLRGSAATAPAGATTPLPQQEQQEQPSPVGKQEVFQDEDEETGRMGRSDRVPTPPIREVVGPTRYRPSGTASVVSELEAPTVLFQPHHNNTRVSFRDEDSPNPIQSRNSHSTTTTEPVSNQQKAALAKQKQQEQQEEQHQITKNKNKEIQEWNQHVKRVALVFGCLGCLLLLACAIFVALALSGAIDVEGFGNSSNGNSSSSSNGNGSKPPSNSATKVPFPETDPPMDQLVLFPPRTSPTNDTDTDTDSDTTSLNNTNTDSGSTTKNDP